MKERLVSAVKKSSVGAGALALSGTVLASEPVTGAAQAFTEVEAMVDEYMGYAWPVAIGITLGLIGLKMFKKIVNRST